MKKRRLEPRIEGMEERLALSSPRSAFAAFAQRQAAAEANRMSIKGTAFGQLVDKGPGTIFIDTARPLLQTGSLQTVHGILNRDQTTSDVKGWIVVTMSGKPIRLEVHGNAKNTSLMGSMVNLKFSGEGEFASKIRPGNIRLMLNSPIRGRLSITFA